MIIEGILATLVATSTLSTDAALTPENTTRTTTAAGAHTEHVTDAPEKKAEPPKKVGAGTQGWFQPGILLQAWFWLRDPGATTTTFRLRRAELRAQGELIPDSITYSVMADFARVLDNQDTTITLDSGETFTIKQPAGGNNGGVMQDLFITFKSSVLELSIGQYKTPISLEGYSGSSKTLFPERSLASTTYGDKRDIGLRATKTFKYFMYSAGIFNGGGQNILDTNNSKDLALRAEIYPIEGLTVGGAVLATVGARDESGAKDRYEGDLRFEKWGVILQAEYIRAHDVGRNGAETRGYGYYVAGAFKPIEELQFGVRYGRVDPDMNANIDPAVAGGRDEVSHYEGLVTYFFQKFEARIQASLSQFEFDQRSDSLEGIVAAQVSY